MVQVHSACAGAGVSICVQGEKLPDPVGPRRGATGQCTVRRMLSSVHQPCVLDLSPERDVRRVRCGGPNQACQGGRHPGSEAGLLACTRLLYAARVHATAPVRHGNVTLHASALASLPGCPTMACLICSNTSNMYHMTTMQ